MKIALIYVIDPPALTIQAILLSASVRRHLPDADLIAYCPEEKITQVCPENLSQLWGFSGALLFF